MVDWILGVLRNNLADLILCGGRISSPLFEGSSSVGASDRTSQRTNGLRGTARDYDIKFVCVVENIWPSLLHSATYE